MAYSDKQAAEFKEKCQEAVHQLHRLQIRFVTASEGLPADSQLLEHLRHGAARRLWTMKQAVQNVYEIFPPDTKRPLGLTRICNAQINLHAFLTNLYGFGDNLAWTYVLKHNISALIADRKKIGLFIDATKEKFPAEIKGYLDRTEIKSWHLEYAKTFRDALAHRIPPYIPPAQMTHQDGFRYGELELEKLKFLERMDMDKFDEISAEQATLGEPCFCFLHAYNEGAPVAIRFHPQIVSDALTIVELGNHFLSHWEKPPN